MPLDHRPPKIVTKRGQKKVRSRTSGNKSQIPVIGCVSASGQTIPPFVIFDAKGLNKEWTKGEVSGTTYGMSSKGWVDSELFRGWLTDHFLQFAVAARPLLLVLDGHSSHYQPELIQYAKEKDVILFCLPPHTSHESQPLDISVFKPLKQNWQDACHNFMQSNPGKVITKYQFSPLLSEAWMATMTPANICSGFRKCGVYPFNPNAIDCTISTDNPAGQVQRGAGNEIDENEGGGDGSRSAEDFDDHELPSNALSNPITFPAEKEQLFKVRYEEGYDLYDEEYLQWLSIHHPDTIHTNPEVEDFDDHELPSNARSSPITFPAEKEQLFKVPYEEGYDLYDEEYLQWLNIHHPDTIHTNPEAPEAPPDFSNVSTTGDLLSFAGDCTLEDCLMQLDHMLGMEDEDGGEEETAFQEDRNEDTDRRQSSFDFTSASGSTSRPPSTPGLFVSPGSTSPSFSPGSPHTLGSTGSLVSSGSTKSLASPGSAGMPHTPGPTGQPRTHGSTGSLSSPGSTRQPHTSGSTGSPHAPGSTGSLTSPGSTSMSHTSGSTKPPHTSPAST